MENFRFENEILLVLLLFIPLIILVYILMGYVKRRDLKKLGNVDLLKSLMPERSPFRKGLKFSLLLLALAALIFAVARPQFGSKLKEAKKEGMEIIIALDISKSMLAEDIKPNRLERAKQAIFQLMERLTDDKVGLIVFAGDSYVQIPITTDYSSAKLFLSNIGPDIAPRQGTAIGSAIDLAMKSFSPQAESSKAIIIITDGENHEDDAMAKAKEAAEEGIKIYTIGMGLPKGAPVPVSRGSKTYLKDKQGNVVISKMNQQMLSKIAAAGDGEFFLANNTRIGLNKLYDKLNRLDKEVFETQVYDEYDDQFPYLVWIALVVLIIEAFILERKNKYLSKLKLFDQQK